MIDKSRKRTLSTSNLSEIKMINNYDDLLKKGNKIKAHVINKDINNQVIEIFSLNINNQSVINFEQKWKMKVKYVGSLTIFANH